MLREPEDPLKTLEKWEKLHLKNSIDSHSPSEDSENSKDSVVEFLAKEKAINTVSIHAMLPYQPKKPSEPSELPKGKSCEKASKNRPVSNAKRTKLLLQALLSSPLESETLSKLCQSLDEASHFVLLIKTESRTSIKAIYRLSNGSLSRVASLTIAPARIEETEVKRFFKFDCAKRKLEEIEANRSFSRVVDAISFN